MIVFFFRSRMSRPLLMGCFALLALGAAGCGGAKGDLSGTVSYNGKPVAIGSVLLIGVDSKPRTAWIEADGSFHFDGVPVGEAKLAVHSPDPGKEAKVRTRRKNPVSKDKSVPPKLDEPELSAGDRTKWFAIPAKYDDVDRSGLLVTISPGTNTYHIEMK